MQSVILGDDEERATKPCRLLLIDRVQYIRYSILLHYHLIGSIFYDYP